MIDRFPRLPGSYALVFLLPAELQILVGRLGAQVFPPGKYLYLGSARGSGGLRGRMMHHLSPASKPHWHIDSMRNFARLSTVWYVVEPLGLECAWSQALAALPGAFTAAVGFGASDCRRGCASHLVGFPPGAPLAPVEDCLGSACQGLEMARIDLIIPRGSPKME